MCGENIMLQEDLVGPLWYPDPYVSRKVILSLYDYFCVTFDHFLKRESIYEVAGPVSKIGS